MEKSPYYATWGPTDGPIRAVDCPPALGVVVDLDAPPMPIGIANCVGFHPDPKRPIATFRLTVHKVDLPGRYVCDRRRFVLMPNASPLDSTICTD